VIYRWRRFSVDGGNELEADAFLDEAVTQRESEVRHRIGLLEALEIWLNALPACTQSTTDVGAECRHDMLPSVQLPSVSGVDRNRSQAAITRDIRETFS